MTANSCTVILHRKTSQKALRCKKSDVSRFNTGWAISAVVTTALHPTMLELIA
jgi:hypothetical protein